MMIRGSFFWKRSKVATLVATGYLLVFLVVAISLAVNPGPVPHGPWCLFSFPASILVVAGLSVGIDHMAWELSLLIAAPVLNVLVVYYIVRLIERTAKRIGSKTP